MNNKTKKLSSVILALTLSLSVSTFITGCKNKKEKDEFDNNTVKKYTYTDGVHELNATDTDNYMVKANASDYQILLPNDGDANIYLAESELKYFFKQATGVQLKTVTEDANGLTHSETAKYISIGNTKMFKSSGVDLGKAEGKNQSVRIVTKDNTVYLNGGDSLGCVFAVYDFLQICFDYDQYSYDSYDITKVNNLKLKNFNVTDIPDIEMRSNAWKMIQTNPNNLAYRFRLPYDFSSYILNVGDTTVEGWKRGAIHNSLYVIPREASTSRLNWFSTQGEQICYTAHGNEEDYNALIEQIAKIIEESLVDYPPEKYPIINSVTFTMMDNSDTCKCPACNANTNLYGTESASVIILCNNVMEKIQEWMNKPENANYKRDNFKLLFFAYNTFIDPPVHYDETLKKYVVNDEKLKMRDDVGVFYAVSSGLNYQFNIYDERSKEGLETCQKWFDISPTVYLWTYNTNFGGYIMRTNSTNFYNSDAYQLFAYGNVKLIYNQGTWNSENNTAFQMLNSYLDGKLSWNTTLDQNVLIDKWFKGMYKEGADDMFSLFVDENLYSIVLFDQMNKVDNTGIINANVGNSNYWPYQMLVTWLEKIEKARGKVEKYKELNPELYNVIKENIDTEWIFPAYYTLNYHDSNLTSEKYNDMALYFKTEITKLKDIRISERATTSLATWIKNLELK